MSDRRILSEFDLGANSVEEIGRRCGAGTNCGGCIPLIEDILESRLVALVEAEKAAISEPNCGDLVATAAVETTVVPTPTAYPSLGVRDTERIPTTAASS